MNGFTIENSKYYNVYREKIDKLQSKIVQLHEHIKMFEDCSFSII